MEKQRKVLVVDDDEFALQSMAKVLGGESYQVVTAASGSEAIALLRQESFDLVLTDLKMPEVDGLEVLRRAREIVPQALVLILTGYASLESAIEALREGAYDYLLKPCSADELKLKIEKGLERVRLAEERQRAENTLRESEERLRRERDFAESLVETAQVIVLVLDTEGRILQFNPYMEEISGYPLQEVQGKDWFATFLPKHDHSRVRELFLKAVGDIQTRGNVNPIVTKDGREREIEWYDKTLKDDGGNVVGLLAIGQDVTERREAEKELEGSIRKLQRSLEGTISVLVSATEMRDPYTAGHQQRVAKLACAIAREMGLPEEQIEGLRMAGLIHDFGKISIPAEILSKPGRLTDIEWSMIRNHPQVGHNVLKTIEFPWPLAEIVLQHHERLDGSGYPAGLSGEEIVLEAKILAVADVVEAMSSHRPYRPARGIHEALEEISQNRGVLYEAEVVDVCLKLFTEKRFKFEEGE